MSLHIGIATINDHSNLTDDGAVLGEEGEDNIIVSCCAFFTSRTTGNELNQITQNGDERNITFEGKQLCESDCTGSRHRHRHGSHTFHPDDLQPNDLGCFSDIRTPCQMRLSLTNECKMRHDPRYCPDLRYANSNRLGEIFSDQNLK